MWGRGGGPCGVWGEKVRGEGDRRCGVFGVVRLRRLGETVRADVSTWGSARGGVGGVCGDKMVYL